MEFSNCSISEWGKRMNRKLSLVLIPFLCLLAACETQPISVPDPDEVELDPEVVEIYEGGNGSAILNIKHGVESGWGFVIINESFTILVERDPDEPRSESMIWGEAEAMLELSVTAPLYGGGTHTSTMQVPVSYTVEGGFYPYPRCEFELQITEYLAMSEVTSMENSVLGTIPVGADAAGEDIITFFPRITLGSPEYNYDIGSIDVMVVSIETVVLDGDSGCMFTFAN